VIGSQCVEQVPLNYSVASVTAPRRRRRCPKCCWCRRLMPATVTRHQPAAPSLWYTTSVCVTSVNCEFMSFLLCSKLIAFYTHNRSRWWCTGELRVLILKRVLHRVIQQCVTSLASFSCQLIAWNTQWKQLNKHQTVIDKTVLLSPNNLVSGSSVKYSMLPH